MSSRSESQAVRTSNALLIGAIADSNSLLTAQNLEVHLLPLVKSICQDFNWEVRREICGQLPFIAKRLSPSKAYAHLYPELVELLDDEEREVVITAVEAFSVMMEHLLANSEENEEILN